MNGEGMSASEHNVTNAGKQRHITLQNEHSAKVMETVQ